MTDFARTYARSSLIYVSHVHPAWDPARKKFSRKFGNLKQSPAEGLSRMLREHREQVRAFLLERAGLPPEEPEGLGEAIEVASPARGAAGGGGGVGLMREKEVEDVVASEVGRGSPRGVSCILCAFGASGGGGFGGVWGRLMKEGSRSVSGTRIGIGNMNGEEDGDTIMVAGGVVPED